MIIFQKCFYSVKGEFSDTPHTEIYVTDSKKIDNYLEKSIVKKCGNLKNFQI